MPTPDEPLILDVSEWVNCPPIDLAGLRGRVVMIETFQMLCPGCVSSGLPQARRVHETLAGDDLVVLGLHTVFEHHDVMGTDALEAFLFEYRIPFPVAVDRHDDGPIPATMAHYELQGTPSTLLVDRTGRVRHTFFGTLSDLALGVQLGGLLAEPTDVPATTDASAPSGV